MNQLPESAEITPESTAEPANISLRDLRLFLVLAERRSIVAAAEELNMTPSGLSRAVQALEVSSGVRLFERRQQGLVLTDAGAYFKGTAQRLAESYIAAVAAVKAGRDSQVSLAISNILTPLVLPALLKSQPFLKAAHSLLFNELPSQRVVAQVASGTADLGLCMCADTAPYSAVDVMPLLSAPLGLLASPDVRLPAAVHNLEALLRLPQTQLARLADDMVLPQALRSYSTQHSVAFDAYFASRLVSNSMPALFTAVAGGQVVTLVSAIAAHSAPQTLQFLPLPQWLPTLQLCLIGRRGSDWPQLHGAWVDAIVASVQSAHWPASVTRL